MILNNLLANLSLEIRRTKTDLLLCREGRKQFRDNLTQVTSPRGKIWMCFFAELFWAGHNGTQRYCLWKIRTFISGLWVACFIFLFAITLALAGYLPNLFFSLVAAEGYLSEWATNRTTGTSVREYFHPDHDLEQSSSECGEHCPSVTWMSQVMGNLFCQWLWLFGTYCLLLPIPSRKQISRHENFSRIYSPAFLPVCWYMLCFLLLDFCLFLLAVERGVFLPMFCLPWFQIVLGKLVDKHLVPLPFTCIAVKYITLFIVLVHYKAAIYMCVYYTYIITFIKLYSVSPLAWISLCHFWHEFIQ